MKIKDLKQSVRVLDDFIQFYVKKVSIKQSYK